MGAQAADGVGADEDAYLAAYLLEETLHAQVAALFGLGGHIRAQGLQAGGDRQFAQRHHHDSRHGVEERWGETEKQKKKGGGTGDADYYITSCRQISRKPVYITGS